MHVLDRRLGVTYNVNVRVYISSMYLTWSMFFAKISGHGFKSPWQ